MLSLFRPSTLKALAQKRLSDVVLGEVARARKRVSRLERRYPTASRRELAQRLVDAKKKLASTVGGVSGFFGLAALPVDWLLMLWLEIALLVDLATLYKVNLKSERAREELLDVLGDSNGMASLGRSGPKLLGRMGAAVFERTGWRTLGRLMPVVAAPVTAYLNHRQLQRVGRDGVRFYEGFEKARAKKRQSGAEED